MFPDVPRRLATFRLAIVRAGLMRIADGLQACENQPVRRASGIRDVRAGMGGGRYVATWRVKGLTAEIGRVYVRRLGTGRKRSAH